MTRKLVLFDIDGTILLTAGAGRRAILAALSEEVGPVPAFAAIRFDGKTDPQIVADWRAAMERCTVPATNSAVPCCLLYTSPSPRD